MMVPRHCHRHPFHGFRFLRSLFASPWIASMPPGSVTLVFEPFMAHVGSTSAFNCLSNKASKRQSREKTHCEWTSGWAPWIFDLKDNPTFIASYAMHNFLSCCLYLRRRQQILSFGCCLQRLMRAKSKKQVDHLGRNESARGMVMFIKLSSSFFPSLQQMESIGVRKSFTASIPAELLFFPTSWAWKIMIQYRLTFSWDVVNSAPEGLSPALA